MIKTFIKLLLGRGSFRSFSQAGEDGIVRSLVGNKKGFYVDVGAYHPHLYSNTYALYRAGWRGLAIDPNPRMPLLFRIFRPRDTFVCAGIGEGAATYHMYKDGAYNGFVPTSRSTLVREYPVTLRSLAQILEEQGVREIDFLDIDVEGLDLEVLRSHDWSILPRVISVEAEAEGPVQKFLEEKGYAVVASTGLNLIFKRT